MYHGTGIRLRTVVRRRERAVPDGGVRKTYRICGIWDGYMRRYAERGRIGKPVVPVRRSVLIRPVRIPVRDRRLRCPDPSLPLRTDRAVDVMTTEHDRKRGYRFRKGKRYPLFREDPKLRKAAKRGMGSVGRRRIPEYTGLPAWDDVELFPDSRFYQLDLTSFHSSLYSESPSSPSQV